MIPCPVKGCRQRCRSPDTLFVHCMRDHQKNDVVAALIRLTVAVIEDPLFCLADPAVRSQL